MCASRRFRDPGWRAADSLSRFEDQAERSGTRWSALCGGFLHCILRARVPHAGYEALYVSQRLAQLLFLLSGPFQTKVSNQSIDPQ